MIVHTSATSRVARSSVAHSQPLEHGVWPPCGWQPALRSTLGPLLSAALRRGDRSAGVALRIATKHWDGPIDAAPLVAPSGPWAELALG
eukprot:6532297-Prymnesium_polylepis.1